MAPGLLLPLFLVSLLFGCSPGPPDPFIREDLTRMVMIDREMGFEEEITGIEVLRRRSYGDQVEIQVRVSGWAVHPEIAIGATLPAHPVRRSAWSIWKYFCSKQGREWEVVEKYKVAEGFEGSGS